MPVASRGDPESNEIAYSRPAMAWNRNGSRPGALSVRVTGTRLVRAFPSKTATEPTKRSNVDINEASPEKGERHFHQTVCPEPPDGISPGSRVAPKFQPSNDTSSPINSIRS